jgi:hypothetical protein
MEDQISLHQVSIILNLSTKYDFSYHHANVLHLTQTSTCMNNKLLVYIEMTHVILI